MQSNLDRKQNLWHSEQLADIHVQDQTKQNKKKQFVFVDPPMYKDLF